MSSQALTLVLCSLLASAGAQAPTRASLEIDASDLGEAGPFVAERLEARAELVLRDGDVLPGHRASDPVIVVRVDTLGEATGYRFSYEVQRSGVLVEDTRGSGECRLCNEGELSAQIDAAISRLIPRLVPESPEAEAPPTDVPSPAAAATVAPESPGWTVGTLGGAGIVLAATGGLTLGLGTGLAVAEPVLLEGGDRNRTVTVVGVAVAVTGAALLATGVTMMLIERRRSLYRGPRQAWSPAAPSRVRF